MRIHSVITTHVFFALCENAIGRRICRNQVLKNSTELLVRSCIFLVGSHSLLLFVTSHSPLHLVASHSLLPLVAPRSLLLLRLASHSFLLFAAPRAR